MYILTIHGKEREGAYSVQDQEGQHVLYLFAEGDDAMRYAMMLEDMDYPEMNVVEVEDDAIIKTCQVHGYRYSVITPNDIVVPPEGDHDFI